MTNNIQLNSICHLLNHKNKRGLIQALYGSYEVVAAPENAVKINVINTNKRYTKNRHLFLKISIDVISSSHHTKNKFPIKDFFNKCDQIHRKLQVWSHLLKSLMENLVFCAVSNCSAYLPSTDYCFQVFVGFQDNLVTQIVKKIVICV